MSFLSLLFFILWFSLAIAKPSLVDEKFYDNSLEENEDIDEYDEYTAGASIPRDKSKLWENGIIRYIFEDNTEWNKTEFTTKEKTIVRHAMNIIESQLYPGCIKFIKAKAGCVDCLKINKAEEECKTTIGRMKSNPNLTLGAAHCFSDNGPTVLHELGHALGFVHEQTRPDRDDYINVKKDLLYAKREWIRRNKTYGETHKTPYDVHGVMHYPATLGCKGNRRCITVKQPYKDIFTTDNKTLLEKYPEKLSAVDRYEISCAYNCKVYSHVLDQYIEYAKKIQSAKSVTINNETCLHKCEQKGKEYFWCYKTSTQWDYCSPSPNTTDLGKECISECLQHNVNGYFSCNVTGGGWGFCSPQLTLDIHNLTVIKGLPAQCSDYMILDEADRSVTNNNDDGKRYFDDEGYVRDHTSAQWKGEGYYRFMEPAGSQLPEYAPGFYHCGTDGTGWLHGKHPDDIGVEVNRTVSIVYDRGIIEEGKSKFTIKVTNCKGFYVYFLPDINIPFYARYCGVSPT